MLEPIGFFIFFNTNTLTFVLFFLEKFIHARAAAQGWPL
jgi:hypothetical protein